MQLEVVSPHHTLFTGEIKQATLQTYVGEITILPEHMPLVSIIKPGLLKIIPANPEQYNSQTFLFDKKHITISIGNGMAYTDGKNIKLVVQSGSRGAEESTEELNQQLTHRQKIYDNAIEANDQETQQNAKISLETIRSHLSLQKQ